MSERMEGEATRRGEARGILVCFLEDEDIYFNMCTYLADHLRKRTVRLNLECSLQL